MANICIKRFTSHELNKVFSVHAVSNCSKNLKEPFKKLTSKNKLHRNLI